MRSTRRAFVAATLSGVALGTAGATTASAWSLPPKGEFRRIDLVEIPMPDGVRLRGRLWLPVRVAAGPAPVVLGYIPYRTRDASAAEDDYCGEMLASHGIGFARIDMRGSGDSEGLLHDEYLASEQDDAVEIIAWLARQSWCNGAVGMRGISWGGFSALQTAMRRPPALKAIMPIACSDRRYTDDAHYIGGCLGLANFEWGASFRDVMTAPPDPAVVGTAWERMWRERLAASPAIMARWTEHDHEDAYWRQGSLYFDYAAITCPTYFIAGWADSYVSSAPRLMERLRCPRKALVGPWGHTQPWAGGPGPMLDWSYEELRWWSHWLLGEPTGIMDEPMLRIFCPSATPSQSASGDIPGHWAAEATWPARSVRLRPFYLTDAGLTPARGAAATPRRHTSRNAIGLQTPKWLPFGRQDLPSDQSPDDKLSISYDSTPLNGQLQLLGTPVAHLRLSADKPVAQEAVRMFKVMPDGTSWRLAYGLLNLTHRDGHELPRPLVAGEAVDVQVPLGFIAHQLNPGERLRIAISEGLWPLVWPSPDGPTLTLEPAASRLELPIRTPPLLEPAMPIRTVSLKADPPAVAVTMTAEGQRLGMTVVWPDEVQRCANGTELSGFGPNIAATIIADDPNSGIWSGERVSRFRRGDWNCTTRVIFEVRSTQASFDIAETIYAYKNGIGIFERSSRRTLPRSTT